MQLTHVRIGCTNSVNLQVMLVGIVSMPGAVSWLPSIRFIAASTALSSPPYTKSKTPSKALFSSVSVSSSIERLAAAARRNCEKISSFLRSSACELDAPARVSSCRSFDVLRSCSAVSSSRCFANLACNEASNVLYCSTRSSRSASCACSLGFFCACSF